MYSDSIDYIILIHNYYYNHYNYQTRIGHLKNDDQVRTAGYCCYTQIFSISISISIGTDIDIDIDIDISVAVRFITSRVC